MKVVLFDGIQEMHVPQSLQRALYARGHEVFTTGKITSGVEYVKEPAPLTRVQAEIEKVLSFDPDLIIVFRPSALPPDLLKLLRMSGARIFAWFSDDPVLWSFTYKYSVLDYDMILHCGNQKVLEFYEEKFQIPTGVNFPFWTDSHCFPYVYGSQQPETELVFLGNTNGQVRRQRYYDLSTLESSIRIQGNTGPDYFNISGGYLDTHAELQSIGATAQLAVSIPQHFRDYRGMKHWFDEMSTLGFFETPSRVIQCAAMGLPIISVEPKIESESSMRSLVRVSSIAECNKLAKELLQNRDLAELSRETNIEFQKYFSADARVLFLEELMESDSWRKLTPRERSSWFRDFSSSAIAPASKNVKGSKLDLVQYETYKGASPRPSTDVPKKNTNVLIVGERWNRRFSPSTVLSICLEDLGYVVTRFDSTRNGKSFTLKDPSSLFRGIVDIESFAVHVKKTFDFAIFIDDSFYPSCNSSNIPIIFHSISSSELTMRILKIYGIAHHVTFLNSSLVSTCKERGMKKISYVPDLVDNQICRVSADTPNKNLITVVLQRQTHHAVFAEIIDPLVERGAKIFVAESEENENVPALVEALSSEVVILLPDPSRPGNIGSRFIGHSLLLASIVGVYREPASACHHAEGRRVFSFNTIQELALKVLRLLEIDLPLSEVITEIDRYRAANFLAKALDHSDTNIINIER